MSEKFRLAVSIGHGKDWESGAIVDDPGARHINIGLNEFDCCMKYKDPLLALIKLDPRFEVYAVQPDIPLRDRLSIINGVHTERAFDLAVELHLNAFKRPEPDYVEVYHYATRDGISSVLGKAYGDALLLPMMRILEARDMKNDKLSEPFGDEEWERKRYGFVKGCKPPAIVIEPWFISNDKRATDAIVSGLYSLTAVAVYMGLVECLKVKQDD